jgi:hypothetical protein
MGRPKGSKNKGGENRAAPVSNPEMGIDIDKILGEVTIPDKIKEVAITSDGQVFCLPDCLSSARKHQAQKKLTIVYHKL